MYCWIVVLKFCSNLGFGGYLIKLVRVSPEQVFMHSELLLFSVKFSIQSVSSSSVQILSLNDKLIGVSFCKLCLLNHHEWVWMQQKVSNHMHLSSWTSFLLLCSYHKALCSDNLLYSRPVPRRILLLKFPLKSSGYTHPLQIMLQDLLRKLMLKLKQQMFKELNRLYPNEFWQCFLGRSCTLYFYYS